jgi:hypothetical protein
MLILPPLFLFLFQLDPDLPEHVTGALKAGAELQWTATTCVFVLIGDAPCHGSEVCLPAGGRIENGE